MNQPVRKTGDAPSQPWVMTFSGKQVNLVTPHPDAINIQDIAQALAMQCRFNGQSGTFYSVAQHSVHVMSLVPSAAKPYALLHDAHEAYIGDITSPVKNAILNLGKSDIIRQISDGLDRVIARAFGLNWPTPPTIRRQIAAADKVALATERRDLFVAVTGWDEVLPEPDKKRIRPQHWPEAAEKFMFAFYQCLENDADMAAHVMKRAAQEQELAELAALTESGRRGR